MTRAGPDDNSTFGGFLPLMTYREILGLRRILAKALRSKDLSEPDWRQANDLVMICDVKISELEAMHREAQRAAKAGPLPPGQVPEALRGRLEDAGLPPATQGPPKA